jgi:hypothetical protein
MTPVFCELKDSNSRYRKYKESVNMACLRNQIRSVPSEPPFTTIRLSTQRDHYDARRPSQISICFRLEVFSLQIELEVGTNLVSQILHLLVYIGVLWLGLLARFVVSIFTSICNIVPHLRTLHHSSYCISFYYLPSIYPGLRCLKSLVNVT